MANKTYFQGIAGSAPISDFGARFKNHLTDYLSGKDFTTEVERTIAGGGKIKGYEWVRRSDDRQSLVNPPVEGEFPDFTFNQYTLAKFYATLRESKMYKGMFEGLGRAAVFADFTVPMPFNKFMQPALEFGDAVLDTAFTDLSSRPWIKNDVPDGSGANPNSRPLLFNTKVPDMMSSVARCEFSREIPLKINESEYKIFVQTGTMLGEIAGAMAGGVAYCYQRDLYEAAKEYFLGCIRIDKEPERAAADTSTRISSTDLKTSPMIELISLKSGETLYDKCFVDKFQGVLHRIVENEFYFPSKKYNPYGKETTTQSATLIMSSKYNYPLFSKLFAETYHPGELGYKMGPSLDLLWVDEIPILTDGIYPTNWELLGMIVDNRALGIIPVTPYKVSSFYNAQEDSNSLFAHYEFIFKFIPFFNRKYIFVDKTGAGNDKLSSRKQENK